MESFAGYNELAKHHFSQRLEGKGLTLSTAIEKSYGNVSIDLFKHIKGVLIVGRLLGIIPISGIFKQSYTQLGFKRKSFASIVTLGITIILTFNLILALIEWIKASKHSALEIAWSIHRTAQYCWGWLIYVSFILRANKFLELFTHWAKTSSSVVYSVEDTKLKRDSLCICVLILVSCVLENGLLHVEYFKKFDDMSGIGSKYINVTNEGQSSLETYYWRSNRHWAAILGYHQFLAVLAFIQHKWMLYTWNYLDVLLAVFGRALYFKFKVLYELSNEHLAKSLNTQTNKLSESNKVLKKAAWFQVVTDHLQLYNLLRKFEEFFCHLVLGSYAVNIYYICIQLLIGLSPEISVNSVIQQIYGTWSFLHMAIRIYIISLCLARINYYAHQIRKVFAECPIEIYKGEIACMDERITSGPAIGMSLSQCVVVSYPFILSIVSVIFTFEIILLSSPQQISFNSNQACWCNTKINDTSISLNLAN